MYDCVQPTRCEGTVSADRLGSAAPRPPRTVVSILRTLVEAGGRRRVMCLAPSMPDEPSVLLQPFTAARVIASLSPVSPYSHVDPRLAHRRRALDVSRQPRRNAALLRHGGTAYLGLLPWWLLAGGAPAYPRSATTSRDPSIHRDRTPRRAAWRGFAPTFRCHVVSFLAVSRTLPYRTAIDPFVAATIHVTIYGWAYDTDKGSE